MEGFFTDKEQAIKFLKDINFEEFEGIIIKTRAKEKKNEYEDFFKVTEDMIDILSTAGDNKINQDFFGFYNTVSECCHEAGGILINTLDNWLYSNKDVTSMEYLKSFYGNEKSPAYWKISESSINRLSKKGNKPFIHEFLERPVVISGMDSDYPSKTKYVKDGHWTYPQDFDNVWIFEDGTIIELKTWNDVLDLLCNLAEKLLNVAKTRENYGY